MRLGYQIQLALQAGCALAATATQWQNRIVYQVLTDRFAQSDGSTTAPCNVADRAYCGGTWQGIITKLDYIKNMGFTAIWISPVTAQIQGNTGDGTAYHGYWQTDLYSLNSAFGTASDLKALADAVHSRGMYLMVDVVANHFAWAGNYDTVDYTGYNPFNNQQYFHSYCPITQSDYTDNQTAVEDCWLGDSNVELTDLDTTRQDVQQAYYSWISSLVSNYSIDGLRVDTVKHVQQDFWSGFNQAAGVYCVGEVFDGDPNYVCPYQDYMDGLLNYPLWYPLTQAFESTSGSMSDLADMVNTLKSSCKNTTLLGTFLENHDNPRFPSLTSDMALDQNAIAFTLLSDGIPIIYEGQEQHFSGSNDPNNREAVWPSNYDTTVPLYSFIGLVNQLRNLVMYQDGSFVDYQAYPIYTDTTTIAMRKGFAGHQIVGVFSNKGSAGASYSQSIPSTGFTSGESLTEVVGCTTVTAASDGSIQVSMGQGAPKIFYSTSNLAGSGICGH